MLSLAERPVFEHRAVVLGAEREELLEGLGALARGEQRAGVVERHGVGRRGGLGVPVHRSGRQRVGMGRELYEAFAVFRDALDEVCDGSGRRSWSVRCWR